MSNDAENFSPGPGPVWEPLKIPPRPEIAELPPVSETELTNTSKRPAPRPPRLVIPGQPFGIKPRFGG